jgi:ATP-binding cassette subfamily C (CFTR/MRP) protein 1
VLFEGSLQHNLDPEGKYNATDLLEAIRKCWVASPEDTVGKVNGAPSLDTYITSGGENLSMGQQQLMALTRAVIRSARIVILDEPSSSLDESTECVLQGLVDSIFRGVTVLCVAHHLKSVLHYDRILVMEDGKLLEDGKPMDLFQTGAYFRKICDRSGIGLNDILLK